MRAACSPPFATTSRPPVPRARRLRRGHVRLLLAALLVALGATAVLLNTSHGQAKAPDPLASGTLARLFPDRDLVAVDAPTRAATRRADRDVGRYLTHHPLRDDRAFLQFAVASLGPPPGGAVTRRELAQLHRVGAHRDRRGTTASLWLEQEGKKAIWKLYAKQYRAQAPDAAGHRAKTQLKQTIALATQLTTAAKAHYARTAPYQVDPTLRGINQRRFSGARKVSYPSKHSVIAVAAARVLRHFEPQRAGEYRWMVNEINYSRLYGGGHYLSDVTGGAYVGELLARYELAAG